MFTINNILTQDILIKVICKENVSMLISVFSVDTPKKL